jgi:magnesium chelatase family protein
VTKRAFSTLRHRTFDSREARHKRQEARHASKLSALGTSNGNSFCTHRPFRAPRYTISDVGLIGGLDESSPSDVSLAHNGVHFLDELPEFKRSTLEVLWQLLEDRKVTVSRVAGDFSCQCNVGRRNEPVCVGIHMGVT